MTTCDVGTAELLTPAQKCKDNAVTFQDSIGLPKTDDPLIGEKSRISNLPKSTKKKLFPADQTDFEKGEDHKPWEGIFSVK